MSLYDVIIFYLVMFYFFFLDLISMTMPLFNKKKKYQLVKSDYVPLPEAKETLIPCFPDIRYILPCVFITNWR